MEIKGQWIWRQINGDFQSEGKERREWDGKIIWREGHKFPQVSWNQKLQIQDTQWTPGKINGGQVGQTDGQTHTHTHNKNAEIQRQKDPYSS